MACYANNVCGSLSRDTEGTGGGREASRTCCEPGPKEAWVGRSSVLSTSQPLKYVSQAGKEALGHSCLVEHVCVLQDCITALSPTVSPQQPGLDRDMAEEVFNVPCSRTPEQQLVGQPHWTRHTKVAS